jgi:hypothetical protein
LISALNPAPLGTKAIHKATKSSQQVRTLGFSPPRALLYRRSQQFTTPSKQLWIRKLRTQAAELVIVNQFRDLGVLPTQGTGLVLLQLYFPEIHAQSVKKKQAPNQ